MNVSTMRPMDETGTSTILQRIAERDRTAVEDCIDIYGNFIWALARKFTGTPEEAAKATEEIFTDIWSYREDTRRVRSSERKLIAMIALRRLVKSLRQAKPMSMASVDAPNEQGAGIHGIFEGV